MEMFNLQWKSEQSFHKHLFSIFILSATMATISTEQQTEAPESRANSPASERLAERFMSTIVRTQEIRDHFKMDSINKQHYPNPTHVPYKRDFFKTDLENDVNEALRAIIKVHEEFFEEVKVLVHHFSLPGLKELIRETTKLADDIELLCPGSDGSGIPDKLERLRAALEKSSKMLTHGVWQSTYLGREVNGVDDLWKEGMRPTLVETARGRGTRQRVRWCEQEEEEYQNQQFVRERKEENMDAMREFFRFVPIDPNTTIWDPSVPDLQGPDWQVYLYHLNRVARDNNNTIGLMSQDVQDNITARIQRSHYKIESSLYHYAIDYLFKGLGIVKVDNPISCYYFDVFRQMLRHHVETGNIALDSVYEYICQMVYLNSCMGNSSCEYDQTGFVMDHRDQELGVLVQTLLYANVHRKEHHIEAIATHFSDKDQYQTEKLLNRLRQIKIQRCDCGFHAQQPTLSVNSDSFSTAPSFFHMDYHLDNILESPKQVMKRMQYIDTLVYHVMMRMHGMKTIFAPYTCLEEAHRAETEDTDFSKHEIKALEAQLQVSGYNKYSPETIQKFVDNMTRHKIAVCPCRYHQRKRDENMYVMRFSADHPVYKYCKKTLGLLTPPQEPKDGTDYYRLPEDERKDYLKMRGRTELLVVSQKPPEVPHHENVLPEEESDSDESINYIRPYDTMANCTDPDFQDYQQEDNERDMTGNYAVDDILKTTDIYTAPELLKDDEPPTKDLLHGFGALNVTVVPVPTTTALSNLYSWSPKPPKESQGESEDEDDDELPDLVDLDDEGNFQLPKFMPGDDPNDQSPAAQQARLMYNEFSEVCNRNKKVMQVYTKIMQQQFDDIYDLFQTERDFLTLSEITTDKLHDIERKMLSAVQVIRIHMMDVEKATQDVAVAVGAASLDDQEASVGIDDATAANGVQEPQPPLIELDVPYQKLEIPPPELFVPNVMVIKPRKSTKQLSDDKTFLDLRKYIIQSNRLARNATEDCTDMNATTLLHTLTKEELATIPEEDPEGSEPQSPTANSPHDESDRDSIDSVNGDADGEDSGNDTDSTVVNRRRRYSDVD